MSAHFPHYLSFRNILQGWSKVTLLLPVYDNFHQLIYLYVTISTYSFFLVLNSLVIFLIRSHFAQNISLIHQCKSILYFPHLLRAGMHNHLFNHLQCLLKVFLSAKTLGFQHEGLDILDGFFVFASLILLDIIVVTLL
jgi:hypothetical protein